jgi:hypothetical protein
MQLIKKFIRTKFFRISFVAGVLVMGALVYLHFAGYLGPYLNPGPISAAQGDGKVIDGFHSHAEFEDECLHCHQPVHCLTASRCQECHYDVAEQRANTEGLHGLLPGTDRCQTCHQEHKGRDNELTHVPTINFDHQAVTGFSLEHHETDYAGNPLTCDSCHGQEDRFSATDMACASCHLEDDPVFAADHSQRFGGECLICHDGVDRMRDFNHATVFVREGKHAELTCEDCHTERVFAGMSGDCASCHEEPEVHAGHFGTDCVRCHVSTGWQPAQLTQHTFELDHGDEKQLECTSCHVTNYTTYACDTCHAEDDMLTAHITENVITASESLAAAGQCGECHPTGKPGEAEAARNTASASQ